ncbi:riboflavin synthase [Coxiella endosymbiont of Amblyomma sculptum]|uniref:riboflavin synthase n=1 Tax=Coxiella endosymbiont of Amblyomma sculptum TaxID=2487929 RepID=UPI001FE2C4F3|nr:riboflavin synthase [Coxiella endosymbiont of Amblyomma sculptum]
MIDHCGRIRSIEMMPKQAVVCVETEFSDLQIGESIAMDGICVTVVGGAEEGRFFCELSSETLERTSANFYRLGNRVNLERALRLMDRMGGHIVTGHIDQTAVTEIPETKKQNRFSQVTFKGFSKEVRSYLIKKGSISINGVSLTINDVMKDAFSVMLIPHTLERTNLKDLVVGDTVNIEFDLIAKIIAQATREKISNEQSVRQY